MNKVLLGFGLIWTGYIGGAQALVSDVHFNIDAGILYRQDNMDWFIGASPSEIMSELTWKDISALQPQLTVHMTAPYGLAMSAFYATGHIRDGVAYDADYNGNKEDIYLLSKSDTKGTLTDFGLQLSKAYALSDVTISADLGWSTHQQRLKMINGFQLIPDDAPYYGAFAGLNNRYDTQWQGFFLGSTISYTQSSRLRFDASFKHHFWHYKAKADWNLRKEFAHPLSFEHSADAKAYEGGITAHYALSSRCYVNGFFNRLSARGNHGMDITYFSDGSMQRYFLNQIGWRSTQYGVEFGYTY